MNLPEMFLEKMRALLGEEFDAFLASFDKRRRNGLRLNRLKVSAQLFESVSPFELEKIPWTENGYYVDYREYPGQHPWYRAGVYYLQEASAMAPAQILPVHPKDRVLDLCAAPGGKATELGARLSGSGMLVANEISGTHARALEHNLELFGIGNCIVTNETPKRLLNRFPAFFDAVLVDAPCSGEGMFRKNPEAVSTWSEEKVMECAHVQREILPQAADMLRAGGYLVYSTCTFEPEENELALAYLLRERPDMELLEIPCTEAGKTFTKAFSLEELCRKGFAVLQDSGADGRSLDVPDGRLCFDREADTAAASLLPDTTKAVRIWPHKTAGEGHFAALLRKKPEPVNAVSGNSAKRKRTKKEAKKGGRTSGPGPEGITKQEWEGITRLLDRYRPDQGIDRSRCEIRDGHVYLMPEGCPDIRGLHFLRAGLYLGDLKKNRFEPSHELALALPVKGACIDKNRWDGGTAYIDDGRYVIFPSGSRELDAFLRGESVRMDSAGENGWRLVCVDFWPVGWGKLTGSVLKNHIPAAWRNRTGSVK